MHLPQTLSSSRFRLMAQNLLENQYVILRYCFPNLCKQNYLYGNLSFYNIQVNHFVAQDESVWCQDYPKMHLMGEGPGAILSFNTFLSFVNRLLVTI